MNAFAPDHAGAEVRPSPNFGPRRDGFRPELIILHYTGMKTGAAAEDWLCNPASEVSSHYLVHEDGRIVQMVRETDRAWHAGKSSWKGVTDINSWSVGIEIVNPGHEFGYVDFPSCQIDAVIELCRGIIARHAVRPEMVLAHSDVAPGRKVDPGERFPWERLAVESIGHFVTPMKTEAGPSLGPGSVGIEVRNLQRMLSQYGYDIDITGTYDERTATIVSAFQRHFRPVRVDGVADVSTTKTLQALCSLL